LAILAKTSQLLDDQVLIATETQETRDLLRILVDVFKESGDDTAILTPANFSLTSEKSGVTSLLDSVASQLHRDLRENALRNLEAVKNVYLLLRCRILSLFFQLSGFVLCHWKIMPVLNRQNCSWILLSAKR
jgi:hypothetical protein